MKLRKLEPKDAQGMLEWMKDPSIIKFFHLPQDAATVESVNNFIERSQDTSNHMNLAIVDDTDTYLGTISLKAIDLINRNAEYAISTRKRAHGTGVAFEATKEILRIAFEELNLHRVYLNVLEENERANGFYRKFGFTYEGQSREHINIHGELKNLNWYSILSKEFFK